MKWLTALCVALSVSACGGGSSSSSSQPGPSLPPQRSIPLMYGYFGECDGCTAKVAEHVNVVAAMGWNCSAWPAGVVTRLKEAQGVGITQAIVSTETCCGLIPQASCVQTLFDGLRATGTLGMVKIFYPVDEPDVKGMNDAQVSGVVDTVRQLARSYPELSGLRYGVVYGPGGATPGISAFNLVGRDNYGTGPSYNGLSLRGDQQRILLPGGADPWEEDPQPFVSAAEQDAQIALIWVFTNLNLYDGVHRGVLDNGMYLPYCKAGLQALGKQGVCNG